MVDRAVIEARVREFFERRPAGVVAVYLFGSVARGDAREGSDVDLAVLLAEDPPRTLDGLGLDLADELQAELGSPVQVVVMNAAPCDLTHRILRDGRLLVDREPSVRIRFEVRARNEYFDLKPFLDRYRRVSPETPAPR
jgi:predicted nucleotidyltransferase